MGRARKTVAVKTKRRAISCEDTEQNEQNVKSPAPKRLKKSGPSTNTVNVHNVHEVLAEDGKEFTSSLLKWYHNNKRDLPWRSLSDNLSPTDRAYSVLVSEVMLQQTQVATVIPYYTKWMSRWPTFKDLAQASLNDVNEVWAGMGYYSRAKRLWEAAKKVDGELSNQIPLTSGELQEKLPGVGRYTAGAVASIALGEKAAAVDGNVVRVLSRVRCIGADPSSKVALDHIWKLSDQLVSADEPGNYNQAMMDLGATICTPKKPSCKSCPVAHVCLANHRVQKLNPLRELQKDSYKSGIEDIENALCGLCLKQPWDSELGVMNFPQKPKKTAPRKEVTLVCVMHVCVDGTDEYLLVKRPQGGLLAGLWEFPSLLFEGNRDSERKHEKEALETILLKKQWKAKLSDKRNVCEEMEQETTWMNSDDLQLSAISTAMKKVFSAFSSSCKKELSCPLKGRSKAKKAQTTTPSRKVSDFFKKVEK